MSQPGNGEDGLPPELRARLDALYRRMDVAGSNWSEVSGTDEGRIGGVLHQKRSRLRRAADRLMRSSGIWLSNGRTSGRRAHWERLLT